MALEMEDVPSAAAAPVAPAAMEDVPGDAVQRALAVRDYDGAVAAAAAGELSAAAGGAAGAPAEGGGAAVASRASELVLALLAAGRASEAWFAAGRAPAGPVRDALVAAADGVRRGNFAGVHARLREVAALVGGVQAVVAEVEALLRVEALRRVVRAYGVVRVAMVADVCGVAPAEVEAVAAAAGWRVADGFLEVGTCGTGRGGEGGTGAGGGAVRAADVDGSRMSPEESLAALTAMTEQLVRLQTA